jgi:DNA-binding LacI/PurR family transcriptional regulator
MRMNLKEIAEKADVSQATVSLVLNNRKGVGQKKRELVKSLLLDNGYKINSAVKPAKQNSIRLLKMKKHGKLVDGNPGFVTGIIDSIEKECKKTGYNLIISNCDIAHINDAAEIVNENPTDGLLILGTELDNDDDLKFLSHTKTPVVIIDNFMPMKNISCITMNNTEAIYSSVKHLLELGHSNIGFLANKIPSNNCQDRFIGFKKSLRENGHKVDDSIIYNVMPTTEGSYESIKELLQNGVKFPSALVANNDSIALGAMKAFKEYKIKIPDEISIIGFDNIPFSSISDPPLTTIDVPRIDIGIWAVRFLCDRIKYPKSAVTKMLVNTTLLVRSSTAPYNPNTENKHVIK